MKGQNEKLHIHKQEKSCWLTKRDIYKNVDLHNIKWNTIDINGAHKIQ